MLNRQLLVRVPCVSKSARIIYTTHLNRIRDSSLSKSLFVQIWKVTHPVPVRRQDQRNPSLLQMSNDTAHIIRHTNKLIHFEGCSMNMVELCKTGGLLLLNIHPTRQ